MELKSLKTFLQATYEFLSNKLKDKFAKQKLAREIDLEW